MSPPPVSAAQAALILGDARDGGLRLRVDQIYDPDTSPWAVPAYRFDMLVGEDRAGTISLRAGDDARLLRYAGHIGFSVEPAFRGRRLAGRAARLLLPLAASHDLRPLWLHCSPDNRASMAVMAWLGATYVETVAMAPDYHRYYDRGMRHTRRYRLEY